jgi:hypothetical protein
VCVVFLRSLCACSFLDDGVECSEANKAALPCGNQCTNCGRYCRIDPNGSLEKPPNGADVVRQSVIQKCLYWWAQNENQPLLWWQYAEARQALNCVEDADAEGCTSRAFAKANIPASAIEWVNTKCKGDMGIYTDDTNDVLEDELQWQYDWMPPTSPYLYVNKSGTHKHTRNRRTRAVCLCHFVWETDRCGALVCSCVCVCLCLLSLATRTTVVSCAALPRACPRAVPCR